VDACPKCGGEVRSPHPARFSMDDRYRKYRLIMRRMEKAKDGA
jgi:H/ACA ribonucleoprotein complex subunit 3